MPYHYKGAAMTQWIALAAYGQWVMGSNPTRVIGGVSQPTIIAPVLQRQISHKTRSEKSPIQAEVTKSNTL